jgi:hypothetical protein
MKTYVIIISKHFPAKHPEHGSESFFKRKIKKEGGIGIKEHTIRLNYGYWKKKIDKVNAGEAVLSLRQWAGKPRRSQQVEFLQLKKGQVDVALFQITELTLSGETVKGMALVDGKSIPLDVVATNDGLSPYSWYHWFKEVPLNTDMALIYLNTEFRY